MSIKLGVEAESVFCRSGQGVTGKDSNYGVSNLGGHVDAVKLRTRVLSTWGADPVCLNFQRHREVRSRQRHCGTVPDGPSDFLPQVRWLSACVDETRRSMIGVCGEPGRTGYDRDYDPGSMAMAA